MKYSAEGVGGVVPNAGEYKKRRFVNCAKVLFIG